MPLVVVGLSHHTSPVALREQLAFAEAEIPACLRRLREAGVAVEGVILSTCNRVELYAAVNGDSLPALPALREWLLQVKPPTLPVGTELYAHGEPQSIEHLFRVVSGLDSLVLGETEILGQVKKAYDLALQGGHTGKTLNKAFQRAFNVAKQIRTETNIQRGSTSVAGVAVELAEHIFNSLSENTVLVIGAGDTSEKTARALQSRGAKRILVTNRSLERAEALARELGGQAIPFADWTGVFAEVDIVISSTTAPHYVMDTARLEPLLRQRKYRSLLLIDIAVPRDIDPEVSLLDNVYLYNIDDLQVVAAEALRQRQEEIQRCEAIIREKTKGLLSPAPVGSVHRLRLAAEH